MFLAFVKRRVIVSWPNMMEVFLKHLESEKESRLVRYMRHFHLLLELHLFGLWSEDPKLSQGVNPVHFDPQHELSTRTLSPINYLVLTIPRHRLAPFHQRFLEMGRHLHIGLEVALVIDHIRAYVFPSTSIIFGNLVLQDDGNDCVIEPDVSGWEYLEEKIL